MSIRLGLLIPSTKKVKMKLPERMLKLCEGGNIEVVELDFERPDLYEKGPFDVLLHKVNCYFNIFEPAEAGLRIQEVKEYCVAFRKMVVIDSIEECERLTDRLYQTNLMKSCEMQSNGINIFVPNIIEIERDRSAEEINGIISSNNLKFPVLAKPTISSITEYSHDMCLIFSPEYLKDLKAPCLIQEFCNHGGVVYKVYVVGESFNICEKPSIKNVDYQRKDTLYFNSRNVSKLGKSFLPELHRDDPNTHRWMSCDDNPDLLNRKVIGELCSLIRKLTNLNLFGMDILIEKETGNYALVDVNQFPGYSGINEKYFSQHLVQLVKKLVCWQVNLMEFILVYEYIRTTLQLRFLCIL